MRLPEEPILTEGSIFERLRRDPTIRLDPFLAHAALIYDPHARKVLEQIHEDYFTVARNNQLPFMAFTDTWRASFEKIAQSIFADRAVNEDNANFLCDIRDRARYGKPFLVGGLIGCRGDGYKPFEALSPQDAFAYHLPQITALAATKIDFLFAATLPALSEAAGIAKAMATTSLPYMLSFVIRPNGSLLDGTPLSNAIRAIDSAGHRTPEGYFVNCVHAEVLSSALSHAPLDRVLGFQANTSRKTPEELNNCETLDTQEPESYAEELLQVFNACRLKIGGGCCGTDTAHMQAFAQKLRCNGSNLELL